MWFWFASSHHGMSRSSHVRTTVRGAPLSTALLHTLQGTGLALQLRRRAEPVCRSRVTRSSARLPRGSPSTHACPRCLLAAGPCSVRRSSQANTDVAMCVRGLVPPAGFNGRESKSAERPRYHTFPPGVSGRFFVCETITVWFYLICNSSDKNHV